MSRRVDGAVLAGGRSSRMGVDKARVPFRPGQPMALTVLAALEPVCRAVCLVRRGPEDGLPWRRADGRAVSVIRELQPGLPHPLWGITSALRWAESDAVLIVACDVPCMPTQGFQRLIEAAKPPGAVAWDGERLHPLVAVVWRSELSRAEHLASTWRSAREFVAPFDRVSLPARWLRNVNRWPNPAEGGPLAALRRRLAWLDGPELARALDGERQRLAQRGILDPTDGPASTPSREDRAVD